MATKLNVNRRRIEAEENAVLDLQFAILDILRETGITKEELARRLDVSKARVSQLFAAGANPTVKQVARIFDALDHAFSPTAVPLDSDAQFGGNGCWQQELQLSRATEEEMVYGRIFEMDAANENYADPRQAVAA